MRRIRRSTRQIAGLSLLLLALLPVAWFAPSYLLSVHTPWCPLSHRIRESVVCYVLDRVGGRVLIQHADLERGWRYFEVTGPQGSRRYEIPGSVRVLSPTAYRARLIPGRDDAILLDGAIQPLVLEGLVREGAERPLAPRG